MEKHKLRKTKVSRTIYHILSLIFISTLISCGPISKNQTNITIGDHELGLVYTNHNRFVLTPGKHSIEKESKLILFNTIDSLNMKEFDILDSHARSLYCQVRVKYSITSNHLENIAGLLKYPQSVESYKILLLAQEIKSEVREITGKFEANELKNDEYKVSAQIDDKISERLKQYINITSLEIKIYDRHMNK